MSLRRKARGLGRRGRMARAASALDYTVPGIVDLVPQPTPMSCWAASYTMLRNWANNQSRTIETNLAAIKAIVGADEQHLLADAISAPGRPAPCVA